MRDLTRPFSGALAKMTREREDVITTTDSRCGETFGLAYREDDSNARGLPHTLDV